MTLEATIPQNLVPTAAEKAMAQANALGVDNVYLGTPIVATANRIVAELDPVADGALTIAAQPDIPRNLTGLVTDANDSASCVCTITGLDPMGNVIEEVMTVALGVGKSFTGTKIFASVTSAVVSGTSGAASGDTIQLGVGNLIGLCKPLGSAGGLKYAALNDVPVTPDAIQTGDVSLAAVDVNSGTMDGSKALRALFQPGL